MKRREWIGLGAVALLLVGAVALDGLYAPWAAAGAGALAGLCLPLWLRAPVHLHAVEWLGGALLVGGALLSLGRAVQPSMAVWGPLLLLSGLVGLLWGRLLAQRGALPLLMPGLSLLPLGLILHGLWLLQGGAVHQSGRLAGALGYPIALGATGLVGLAVGCVAGEGGLRVTGRPVEEGDRLAACRPAEEGARRVVGRPSTDGSLLQAISLYGSGLALFVSGSRGLWAAAVVTLLALLAGRPHWWRRLLLPLVVAVVAGLWVAPLVAGRAPWSAFLWCLGGALCLWLLKSGRSARWLSGGALIVVAWLAKPGWAWLLGRTQLPGTESASVERLTFLRDAWAVVLHHPLGQGFRSWASVQLTAASYPYWTGEVHSALMDALLNWGWLGGVGLILLLGRLWWGAWALRRADDARFALMVGAGGLALHGLVDWTLSYGLFAGVVAMGLGLVWRGDSSGGTAQAAEAGHRTTGGAGRAADRTSAGRFPLTRPVVALLGGILAAASILLGAGEWAANSARNALRQGAFDQALSYASLAQQLAPWHEEGWAVQGEAQLIRGESKAAVIALERAARMAPLEPWYEGQLAEARFASGDEVGGLQAYQAMVQRQPWAPEAYDRALGAHVTRYLSAILRHDEAMAVEARSGGRLLLQALDEQIAKVPAGAPRAWRTPDSATIRKARELFQ